VTPPRPMPGPDDAFFWEGVNRSQLLLQHCLDCGALRHPPGPMCPACRSTRWEARPASGRGRLLSYVIPHEPLLPGFEPGYVVGLVELDEGPRIVSNVVAVAPDDLRNGMALAVSFEEIAPGLSLHRFRAP